MRFCYNCGEIAFVGDTRCRECGDAELVDMDYLLEFQTSRTRFIEWAQRAMASGVK